MRWTAVRWTAVKWTAVPRARVAAAAVIVVAGSLAACSTGADGASTAASAASPSVGPTELRGTLAQNREDEVRGVAVVRLTASEPGTVTSLHLQWPGLAPATATSPDYPLVPGVPVDLPVAYGPALCGRSTEGAPLADPPPPTAAPSAQVVLAGSGTRVVVLDDSSSLDLVQRLYARSCRAQAIAAAVDVALAPTWTPTRRADGSPGLAGTLVVAPRAVGEAVQVVGLEGSVLMAFETRVPLPADVRGRLALPVVVGTSGRCDGHALGEAKKTYELTVLLALGDAPAVPVLVRPGPQVRPRMWRTILAGCA